mmetsp:Transcript_26744/g.83780  ORF Transcript_26744/g.83780 Transcript_26744/m.83780 type:complete len:650 (-) Transcript_26744:36-1985(-)
MAPHALRLAALSAALGLGAVAGAEREAKLWAPTVLREWEDRARFLPSVVLDEADVECGDPFEPAALQRKSLAELYEELAPLDGSDAKVSLGLTFDEDGDREVTKVFLARNGENDGVVLDYSPGCLWTLAARASAALGSPRGRLEFRGDGGGAPVYAPLFLHNAVGLPVRGVRDMAVGGGWAVAHVLFLDEAFIWPGVKPGYEWRASGYAFLTLSISPKIIFVDNALNATVTRRVIRQHEKSMVSSPEKTYSDDSKYKNYRTSAQAGLDTRTDAAGKHIQLTAQQVTRLPYHLYADAPQLLRYKSGNLYHKHHDFYHHFWKETATHQKRIRPMQALKTLLSWVEYLNIVLLDNTKLEDLLRRDAPELLPPVHLPDRNAADVDFELTLATYVHSVWHDVVANARGADSYAAWILENIDRGSGGLFSAILKNHPEALLFAQEAWEQEATAAIDGAAGLTPEEREALQLAVVAPAHLRGAVPALSSHAATGDAHACAAGAHFAKDVVFPWEGNVQPNRFATLLYYLSEVTFGGHTVFPRAEYTGPETLRAIESPIAFGLTPSEEAYYKEHAPECLKGLRVDPLEGTAVLFYSQTGDGELDYSTIHAGCPPVQPESLKRAENKWAMNGFMWNVPCMPRACVGHLCWTDEDGIGL